MKKIICLILALTCALGCVFALASCKKDKETDTEVNSDITPTKIVTFVDYTKGTKEFDGEYVMEVEGDNSITSYKYTRARTPEEGALEETDDPYKTIEGNVYYKDGLYSTDGQNWSAEVPEKSEVTFKFDLSEDNFTNIEKQSDGKSFSAEISADKTVAVFGVDLKVEGTVKFTADYTSGRISMVSIKYTTVSGADVSIRTSYTYSPITLEFPGAEG